ncbi:protein METABOLIC NETWORK MODULATOR 1 [Cryptomeria japonica]|uniref:protein METABOLIC NETWORK MODULATOR 1 n=1 Tax=Cryptomeria japonica TaxID=3369 RepID=UPI0025AD7DD2|nr:protein METABOLIC NETWORK MODULATOR 1 [Cryptomeria japonica]XP_057850400.1 protein METABOLIC NETWORK MODULATOR 1 [Cryptomeria japonica]XP_057850409.1 protein METABOLIC NETWORK MODULATOR 1 [Cryptomeria japonica]XP_057850419.1 protein METABOLIC NETWORK MODULATOR 1 [Cryptomeria japonica]XP_057850428.1 protein METABOLIC NETWORK MODULATOR 1 [Cryptomeria japonica]XP_057850436.1 protein METABOLIC NETWORK MODULATOR 1 [Cryptomeria japonica]
MEGNADHTAVASGPSVKKKRGRPRKSETVLLPGEITALGVMPSSESKPKKARLSDTNSSHFGCGNGSLVGQPVHGVLDGSFDAGYLISVRVGDTDAVLRGVVFGPGLSIPPSKLTDVAPKIKSAKKELNTPLSPLYSPPAATPMALSEVYEPLRGTDYTPTESEAAPENGLQHQQNHMSSKIQVQQVHGAILEPIYVSANNQVESSGEGVP